MAEIKIEGLNILQILESSTKNITITTSSILIFFDLNGGDFLEFDNKLVVVGGIYGSLPLTTRVGHTFLGWFTAPFAGNLINELTTVTVETTHTLYAQWSINQYTVSFVSNQGSFVNSKTQNYNTVVTKPTNPTRTGYTFNEWYYDEFFTQLVIWPFNMPDFDQTLYADWTPINYTVTFDGNGATSGTAPSNINATYDVSFIMPQNTFARTNFSFLNWNTQPNGSGISYVPGQSYSNLTSTSGTITLYANWISILGMRIEYTCTNGVWSFSLVNPDSQVQNLLGQGYKPRIQLVRYHIGNRGSVSATSRSRWPVSITNNPTKRKPNYPSYLDSPFWSNTPLVASIDISSFSGSNYTNMNLSTWANNMIKFGQKPNRIRSTEGVNLTFSDFGYFFIDYEFILLINNKKFAISVPLQARYHFTDGSINVNTNYTISGGILNIYKL